MHCDSVVVEIDRDLGRVGNEYIYVKGVRSVCLNSVPCSEGEGMAMDCIYDEERVIELLREGVVRGR